MDKSLFDNQQHFMDTIRKHFAKEDILEMQYVHNILQITLIRSALIRAATFLHTDTSMMFLQLTDITCVHFPDKEDDLKLVYHFLSPLLCRRVCIELWTQKDVAIQSLSSIYPNALWYEREIREMFGVSFENHSDLRCLLTSRQWGGTALLKSFPLNGEKDVLYDKDKEECVYERKKQTSKVFSFGVQLAEVDE